MSAASSIALKQDMPNTSSPSDVLEELKGRFGPPNAGNAGGPMGLVQKTADDLPTRTFDAAPAHILFGLAEIHPIVESLGEDLSPAERDVDHRIAIPAAGLDQEDRAT